LQLYGTPAFKRNAQSARVHTIHNKATIISHNRYFTTFSRATRWPTRARGDR
jgi:hypothetical protein